MYFLYNLHNKDRITYIFCDTDDRLYDQIRWSVEWKTPFLVVENLDEAHKILNVHRFTVATQIN